MLATAGAVFAQDNTATLVGRVTDPTHAVIVGATVMVRDLNTDAIRTATTDKQGEYTVPDLTPSTYSIMIARPGFKDLEQPSVELQVGQTARFDATLVVGSATETVTVTTEVGALHTENGEKGDVISPVEISEMPLDGRDFNDLVFNVAGIAPSEQGSKGSEFVANGTRSDSTNIQVDGINNTNPRDSTAEATPPLDSLEEFKVQTSNYTAEYGRVAGPVINLSIKKGGNVIRGSIFEFVRNDLFDAGNYFDVPGTKSELRRNQFGGTVGGPIYFPHIYNGHDKTFFLLSEESYRQVQGSNEIGVVPSLLERQGDFSQSFNTYTGQPFSATPNLPLYDPAQCTSGGKNPTCLTLTNFMLPKQYWDPIATYMMNAFYPLPNNTKYALPGNNNYIVNEKAYSYWDNVVAKIDQQLAAHDEASIKYLFRHEHTTKPFENSLTGQFGAVLHNLQTIVSFNETHIFNPTLINDFRTGLTRNVNNERAFDSGTNWDNLIGMPVPGLTTPALEQFPEFKPTGYETLGDSEDEPITFTTNNYDTNDTLTWSKGKHTAKIGASMLKVQYFQPTNSEFSGAVGFSGKAVNGVVATIHSFAPPVVTVTPPTATAQNGFLEMLEGYNSSTDLRSGTVVNHLFDTNYAAFVQDDYKVSAGLTLNLGMRYELETLPYEENDQLSNFVPTLNNGWGYAVLAGKETPALDATINGAGNGSAYVAYRAQVGYPRTLVWPNYNRLAPRFGFAYRPSLNDQLVIRGGYGIFYTGSRLSVIRTELSGGFPYSVVQTCTSGSAGLAAAFTSCKDKFSTTNGYDPHAASSYVQSFNLTVERELPKGLAMEVGYSGSKGTHLGRQIDINQENPALGLTGYSTSENAFEFLRPFPGGTVNPTTGVVTYPAGSPGEGFDGINWFNFEAYSNYNALTSTLRKRFEHGLLFRLNFTWARYLDTASALNASGDGGYNGAQYTPNPNAEYGRDDSDRKFVLNGNFVYLLPFHKNIIVSGWESAGSVQVDSGQPFTPQLNGPVQSDGEPTRPNRVCNGALPHPNVNEWFNLDCFPQVPSNEVGIFGNSGRNILTGPKLVTIDLSVSRNFRITDKSKLQFRYEMFNVPNHPNFMLPNDYMDESNGGTITAAAAPRVMQLGAKYQF